MGLSDGPAEVACTNLYLDDAEWAVLAALPSRVLRKRRHMIHRDGLLVVVDEHEDGSLVAEIDDGDQPAHEIPAGSRSSGTSPRTSRGPGRGLAGS